MKIGVLTSGGDAPGMNAAIRAVVRAGIYYGFEVYGIRDGYRGLIDKQFEAMSRSSVSEILSRGGTILGTSRMPEFKEIAVQLEGIKNLKEAGIEALVVIGGDGSYQGAQALNRLGFPTVCIPGTIDNDLNGTDYTIGFHTALATIVDAIDKLRDTASSHQRCSIIETMGRHCGDLAIAAGFSCGAEFIITPEHPMDKEKMIARLKEHKKNGKRNAIIVITEHTTNVYDLAQEITEKSGFACRATVLGYVQRGGSPSAEDRMIAGQMGAYAVELIQKKITGVAIGIRHNELVHMPFEEALIGHRSSLEHLYQLIDKVS